jgi:hypothetical protein
MSISVSRTQSSWGWLDAVPVDERGQRRVSRRPQAIADRDGTPSCKEDRE